jgi:hypothetical protein
VTHERVMLVRRGQHDRGDGSFAAAFLTPPAVGHAITVRSSAPHYTASRELQSQHTEAPSTEVIALDVSVSVPRCDLFRISAREYPNQVSPPRDGSHNAKATFAS